MININAMICIERRISFVAEDVFSGTVSCPSHMNDAVGEWAVGIKGALAVYTPSEEPIATSGIQLVTQPPSTYDAVGVTSNEEVYMSIPRADGLI